MTTNPVGASSLPMSTLTGTGKSTTSEADKSLGQDAFLKLLVAQLKYQDPMNPADGADFMAQTAQFTMVEKLSEMQKQGESTITGQQQLQAIQMVGKQVSYVNDIGGTATGTVESVRFSPTGQTLTIDGKQVGLGNVTEVLREVGTTDVSGALASLGPTLSTTIAAAIREALSTTATGGGTSAVSGTQTQNPTTSGGTTGDAPASSSGTSTSDAAGGEG